jgi:predicted enzyme related to lactoylglutathione lyase
MTTRLRRGRPPHGDLLTSAEWRVVHAVKHGMTSRQIAERRGISVEAVKFHVAAAPESTLYLRVADIAAAHENLRSRGVEFTNAPHMIHRHADGTEEWMAFFKDPEGRTLAIMSQEAN